MEVVQTTVYWWINVLAQCSLLYSKIALKYAGYKSYCILHSSLSDLAHLQAFACFQTTTNHPTPFVTRMATITATLIPRRPGIPLFLPQVPTPHPTPIPPQPASAPGGLNTRRRLRAEIEQLSEEEEQVETQVRISPLFLLSFT